MCVIFDHLPIHSKAVRTIIKEIKAKNTKSAFGDPGFTLEGGGGGNLAGYIDSLYNVSHYLPIHSKPVKAIIKGGKQSTKSAVLCPQFYSLG